MTSKLTLDQHIHDALYASATRMAAQLQHPQDHLVPAEELAELRTQLRDQWMAREHAVVITPVMDRPSKGRPDTRSLRYVCTLVTERGQAELVNVRARDLLDEDGQPVDARAAARTLMYLNGMRIPSSPAGIENAPPLPPEVGNRDGA